MSETNNDSDIQETKEHPFVKIRGLPLLKTFINVSCVEKVMDFKPDDTDVFIVTYPKCGTTWMQYMVWEILHKGDPPPTPNQMGYRYIPFLEYTGVESIENLSRPRVMKTHLPFHLTPYNPASKYIYVVRNPWDCCVSYFHHKCLDTSLPDRTFDEFFNRFIKGEVGWGDYFDHVLSWSKHRGDDNVLFLTYEELKKDTRSSLLKIATFLGESYYEDLQDEEVMQNCLKHVDFKFMKEMGMFYPKSGDLDKAKEAMKRIGLVEREKANEMGFVEVPFFRKAVIGDWKNHFTPVHVEEFNKYMTRKLKNTDMEQFWPLLN